MVPNITRTYVTIINCVFYKKEVIVAILFLVAGLVVGIVISPFLFALLLILYGYLRLFLFGIHIQATVLRVEPYLPGKHRLFA